MGIYQKSKINTLIIKIIQKSSITPIWNMFLLKLDLKIKKIIISMELNFIILLIREKPYNYSIYFLYAK